MSHKMIVGIVAYNRADMLIECLKFLLKEKQVAKIHVSLDFSEKQNSIINEIEKLNVSEPEIVIHKNSSRMGLKRNVYKLCDLLSNRYEEFCIIEDDVIVEKGFLRFIEKVKALNLDQVRQIVLYKLDWDEHNRMPVISPTFYNHLFLSKIPGSQAVYYKSSWWNEFKLKRESIEVENIDLNPTADNWGAQSWKKNYFKFMVKNGYFSIVPNGSYACHNGNVGTNFDNKFVIGFDTPLTLEKIPNELRLYHSDLLYLDIDYTWKGKYANTFNISTKSKLLFNYSIYDLTLAVLRKIKSKL
jgi:GR25 family glycosyltransferase involved in LPS biosynthesis